MNSITTKYSGSKYIAKSWNGSVRVQCDHELNSEQNHRAAALALVRKLNKNPLVEWEIINSAPAPDGENWVFIIDSASARRASKQGITVRFFETTSHRKGFMRAYSWWNKGGVTVNYGNHYDEWDLISGCARHAALQELEKINEICAPHNVEWMLGDYIETFEGNRVFSLIHAKVTK